MIKVFRGTYVLGSVNGNSFHKLRTLLVLIIKQAKRMRVHTVQKTPNKIRVSSVQIHTKTKQIITIVIIIL